MCKRSRYIFGVKPTLGGIAFGTTPEQRCKPVKSLYVRNLAGSLIAGAWGLTSQPRRLARLTLLQESTRAFNVETESTRRYLRITLTRFYSTFCQTCLVVVTFGDLNKTRNTTLAIAVRKKQLLQEMELERDHRTEIGVRKVPEPTANVSSAADIISTKKALQSGSSDVPINVMTSSALGVATIATSQ